MNENAQMIWDERYGDAAEPPPLDQGGDPIHYTLHKFLYEHSIALPTTGRTDGCVVCEVGERFLKPAIKRVLALGAGMAIIEEFLLSRNYAEHIVAYEMSANACTAAMEHLKDTPLEGRLEMHFGDGLADNLARESFDVVFAQAEIHHFEKIYDMFAMKHRAPNPDCLLMYDEYVDMGTKEFQQRRLRLRRCTSMKVTTLRYELPPLTIARIENSSTCGNG